MSSSFAIAVILLLLSAVLSIWVLQLGWLLALIGLVMLLISISPKSRKLALPGVALVIAPLVNIFVLMPILRVTLAGN